ncbi:hypothetical protein ACLOJK_013846 [Asimina triloba]
MDAVIAPGVEAATCEVQHDSVDYDMVVGSNELSKKWMCPWDYSVVDIVAPQFRSILAENYQSTFTPILDDTQRSRFLWWTRRTRLNERLERFLRWGDGGFVAGFLEMLASGGTLKSAILGGAMTVGEVEKCVSELLTYKGYFGSGGCYKEAKQFFPKGGSGVDGLTHQLILEAIIELADDGVDREPVILVLDSDIQVGFVVDIHSWILMLMNVFS